MTFMQIRRVDSLLEFSAIDFCVLGIPAYKFCVVIGFFVTTCVYIKLISKYRYPLSQSTKNFFISILGMLIGAKIFGCLTGIYRDIGLAEPITINSIVSTGIVFYGGLFGFLACYFICIKGKHSQRNTWVLNILAVCIPLFHSIARVGCFLGGCCYGKIYYGAFAVKYTTLIDGNVVTSMRFPVQIAEAILEFLIFIYLLYFILLRMNKKYNLLFRYLMIYGVCRVILEQFRGDYQRGVISGISFSQCISMVVLLGGFIYYCMKKKEGELV